MKNSGCDFTKKLCPLPKSASSAFQTVLAAIALAPAALAYKSFRHFVGEKEEEEDGADDDDDSVHVDADADLEEGAALLAPPDQTDT